ncbi:hypothetical protein AGLY_012429 [Aphis glycines]|uniref:Uncharacterized protein n=1 Tax=Aphis glycines TaxID=307491 RepID=A0A6G0TC92_APHGL|nr:hypothetical protein AGLY_012429 [Aphis glycines]
MRHATPRRPRGTGDRLPLPLPPPSPLRCESPRNEAYNIVVASPELWRPRVPSPAASSSSASSGVADGNDDLVDTPLPDTLDEPEVLVDDALILQPDDTTPLHAFRERFADFNKEPCSEVVWLRFVKLVDEMTAEAAVIAKLPARPEGRNSGRGTAYDPNDAKEIQSLTMRQGREAFIYLKASANGQQLEIIKIDETHNHVIQKILYSYLTNQRKITPENKAIVLELMDMKVVFADATYKLPDLRHSNHST